MEESTAPTSTTNAVDTARPQGSTQRSNSENLNFRTSGSNSSGSSGYGGKQSSLPTAQKDTKTMEDNATTASISNAVDSAYSQSNSRSLSSESSQCRMRGSNSSGSSGYGGKQTTAMLQAQAENSASSGNSAELTTTKDLKRSKNKGRMKKSKTKQSQNRSNDATATTLVQETKSQEIKPINNKSITPTQEEQTTLATDTITLEDVSTNAEIKINRIVESIPDKQAAESETLQKDIPSDTKPIHEHNAIPLSSTESMKDKTDSHLDESSATDKPGSDDLEVDNILSHSKVEQQTAEHRTNLNQESFCCAISMHDGVILSTTANLTDSLGFPKDMWLGRAFIDFVHPKDRPTFASQITSGYIDHISLKEDYLRQSNFEKTPLYVLLRCYRSFDACGFAVKNKPISYKPFKLIFRKAPQMPGYSASPPNGDSALRIICAIALSSIYKVPDEAMKKQNAKFTTRHTAAGILVHIDGTSVSAIGYMPQDIIGKSILDLFHPDDMIILKTASELLMKNTQVADGRVSTPPYRFLIKNGCYITLETKWTRVFNPWSRKLEFVNGDHCILKGPNQCDIFAKTGKFACNFPNVILEKAAILKNELLKSLSEPVPYPSDSVKQQVSKRCQALASFMESLLAGVKRQELKLDWLSECEPAASEHGSVMLGEISPHHHSNHDDSKSSSETPPTYNQLNYFENLNRFFNSVQPTFVPNEFKSLSYQIDHVPTNDKDRMLSPIQQCGEESGGSFNSSSDSPQFESTNTSNTSNNGNPNKKNLVLTEALVSRHTDDMELQMVKNHKKYRTRISDKKKAPDKGHNQTSRNQPMKRSRPNELGGNELGKDTNSHNQNEHRYASNVADSAQINKSTAQTETKKTNNEGRPSTNHAMGQNSKVQAVHLWPPFSVNATTTQDNIPTNTIPNSINQFLLSKHLSTPILSTPQYYVSPVNPNGILKIDQKLSDHSPKVINTPPNGGATGNPSNPYTLQYIKSLMSQPQQFLSQNMIYPYQPLTYQPLPMIQQKTVTTAQASGATNVSLEMPSTSQQAIRKMASDQLSNMVLYGNIDNAEPVNLSTTANVTVAKLKVKPWAKMKEDSDEIDASNSSFSSSFFDSQLRTDESWESDKTTSRDDTMGDNESNASAQGVKKRGKIPYWMKNVDSTPELVLRYQLKTRELEDALQADLRVLREINQPGMVNEQLNQLYFELDSENQGKSAHISLGNTPSNSSEDEENMSKKKKNTHYSKLSMIYEENAPVQPPVEM
ncbi:period circadian protein isoform X2 [Sitodiplosis mosellana]|uniref:period circadian protein isoform X2 n=1 Tax=Sitodiplosis mosellana TaxID=263140 RepID=UPI002444B0A8|nr:period circadian protein isoform X2 [Sitodiplosis mosellana]